MTKKQIYEQIFRFIDRRIVYRVRLEYSMAEGRAKIETVSLLNVRLSLFGELFDLEPVSKDWDSAAREVANLVDYEYYDEARKACEAEFRARQEGQRPCTTVSA